MTGATLQLVAVRPVGGRLSVLSVRLGIKIASLHCGGVSPNLEVCVAGHLS